MKRIILFILFLPMLCGATVKEIYPFTNAVDENRFMHLTQEIRCIVCQNQSIADSNAKIAKDLRQKIFHMINMQQSDQTIKKYLHDRYGSFIFFNPEVNKFTLFLWLFPLAIIFIFAIIICNRLRQSS